MGLAGVGWVPVPGQGPWSKEMLRIGLPLTLI